MDDKEKTTQEPLNPEMEEELSNGKGEEEKLTRQS